MTFNPVNKLDSEKTDEDAETKRIHGILDGLEVKVKESQIDPEFIRNHPPVEGYMAVEVKKAELRSSTPDNTEIVEPCMVMPLDDKELAEGDYYLIDKKTGEKHKIAVYDTTFKTDLHTLINSQLYECPATTFPVIAERLEETARNEQNAKFPDKRSDKKDYFWLYFFILAMVLIVVAVTSL
jgi:hypothetical protein